MKIIKTNGTSYKLGFDKETKQFWLDWASSRGVAKGQFSGTHEAVDFINREVGLQFFDELIPRLNVLGRECSKKENEAWDTYVNIDRKLAYEKMHEIIDEFVKKEKQVMKDLANSYIKKHYIKKNGVLLDYIV